MLLAQEFLLTKTFGELERDHGICSSISKDGRLINLNYDQLQARESDPVSQQCRGVVLSLSDSGSLLSQVKFDGKGKPQIGHICPGQTRIVAYPMNRFFNYGQDTAAKINLSDPTVKSQSKLDGTLCIVYCFDGEWNVGTRNVPQADAILDDSEMTFRSLFEIVCESDLKMNFGQFSNLLDPNSTYCFELCSRFNRIVVDYPEPQIYLLAIRNNLTGQEIDPIVTELVTKHNVRTPKVYKIGESIDQLFDWVNSQSPFEMEGVVLCDGNFNRIKVKSATYVAYNRVHDLRLSTSNRNSLEIVLLEKEDDILPMLPESIGNKLLDIKSKLNTLISDCDQAYHQYWSQVSTIEDSKEQAKEFAKLVFSNKDIWDVPLFAMYRGKCSSTKQLIKNSQENGGWKHSFLDAVLARLGYKGV